MKRACALVIVAALGVGLSVDGEAADARSAAPPARVLYAGDWSGTSQVYAVDPSGRASFGQLTFGRAPACAPANPCGYVAPEPSPDGSRVLFWDYVEGGSWYVRLFVARADGAGRRRLVTVNHFRPAPASWSPDSRRIAYADRGGVRIVSASGGPSRLVAPARDLLFSDLAWSPAGDWIAYRSDGLRLVSPDGKRQRRVAEAAAGFAWSPEGRHLAYSSDGIHVYDSRTGISSPLAAQVAAKLAWSPDGRFLAFWSGTRLGLVIVKSGAVRPLNFDPVAEDSPLSWSPDSRSIAYVRRTDRPLGLGLSELRLVERTGYVRTVVAPAGKYGGTISGVAWTRPSASVRYPRPAGRSLATASTGELVAPFAIQRLAADGPRVAYASCGHAFVWTPSSGVVEQAEDQSSLSPRCFDNRGIVSLAIAGDRVAADWVGGGNTTFWWLGGATLDRARTGFEVGTGSGTLGAPKTRLLGDLVGSGSLLVFSSRDEVWRDGACCAVTTTTQRIMVVESSGCPCRVLASEPGPFVPNDVDDSRIATVGDNAVVLLDFDGKRLLTVDVKARAAQLSGRDLVVHAGERLLTFDASAGDETHASPLVGSASLQDVARGLAAYVLDGQVHVLRLADGRDAVAGPGTLARFLDDGLVYADGARLRFLSFDRLPLPI